MLQDWHFCNYLFGVILNILKWSDGFANIVKQYSILPFFYLHQVQSFDLKQPHLSLGLA